MQFDIKNQHRKQRAFVDVESSKYLVDWLMFDVRGKQPTVLLDFDLQLAFQHN